MKHKGLLMGLLALALGAPELWAEEAAGGHAEHHHGVNGQDLSVLWVLPFAGMLLSIALGPLVAAHFWHAHYGKVAAGWIVLFSICLLYTSDAADE